MIQQLYSKKLCRPAILLWIILLSEGNAWASEPNVTDSEISDKVDLVTITGQVTSSEDGQGLPGVNVIEKNTRNGTITDIDGRYTIQTASDNPVLVISFVGYQTQEVPVSGRSVVDISLALSSESLEEVIVTALGIKREERSLGYSVAEVEGQELSRVAQENVLNGLAGKVPGVTINSTGAAGSSVSMVIRGATSLNGDNQPLFVIDGVPVANTLNNISEIGRDNRVDYGNAISDMNPANIESISILKGPSAAALYGSRAGNGVVLITTKSGSGVDRMTVSVSSNTVFDRPTQFLDMKQNFAMGGRSYTPDNNPFSLFNLPLIIYNQDLTDAFPVLGSLVIPAGNGPELDRGYDAIQWNSPLDENGIPQALPLESHPDNVRNFLQTGISSNNDIAISNSNEWMNYRLAYSNMSSRGIIPNTDLFRNSIGLNSSVKVHENVEISSSLNFNRSNSNNRPAGNRGSNPLQWAYAVTPDVDIRDLEDYWQPGREGVQQRSFLPGEANNPYFLANEIENSFVRDRFFGNVRANWQITPSFSIMGRVSMDQYNEERETRMAPSYTLEPNGAYGIINLTRRENNSDILATYSKVLDELSISVSAGGNILNQSGNNVRNATRRRGGGLIIPGLYTLDNIAPENLDYGSSIYEKSIYSVYGLATFGFRDMIYLDVTARNDWSSTLPEGENSYFYPSASLSMLLNEMMTIPNVDLLKLRAGWAQVGNDTDPYRLLPVLNNIGNWGDAIRLSTPGELLNQDLKPEIATSFEVGMDVGLFNNRLRFEGTYYTVENENQILGLTLPPSSGANSKIINAGLVASRGWELMLGGTPVRSGDWTWDISANFTRIRTTIEELSDGVDIFTLWTDAKGGAWTYVGDEIGDIYDRAMVVVEDESSPYFGYPILDNQGSWQSINAAETKNKIGNFNPDFILGAQTNISYKGFNLNMTFDWRRGGEFVSQTYRYMESDMRSQRWLDQLINPGDLEGDALRDWLVANQDQYITDGVNIVGGPTEELGGHPIPFEDGVTLGDGVFNPGVYVGEDGEYVENLGGDGTKYIPFAANYAWDFTKTALFDADYLKLREIVFSYQLPKTFVNSIGLQDVNVGVFSRNIILWTKAKIGVDPERAFQPEANLQGSGVQLKQGIERYNVTPFVVPIGFKLGLTF